MLNLNMLVLFLWLNNIPVNKIDLCLLFNVSTNKMTRIEIVAIMHYVDGIEEPFGGETGTAEYYMVKDTLQEHLGENNQLLFYNHESKWTFILETKEAENNNIIKQYIDVIENIYQPFDLDRHLRFNVIHVE
jgi:hypothetical protein